MSEKQSQAAKERWAKIKADPEAYQARCAVASEARKGVSVGSRKGIGGWTVENRVTPKCPEGCECGHHSSEWNVGMWNQGRPQTNPASLANLEAWREQQKEWVNGTSYEGQFTYTLRSQVWERDFNRCQDCHRKVYAGERSGVVHHVDFDKGHNELENLVLLCRSCHIGRHSRGDHGRIITTT